MINTARSESKDALKLLRAMIAEGGFLPGSRIPSERELTQKLNVGRSTLRRAFDILEREGVIWRRVGQGTFLSEASTFAGVWPSNGSVTLNARSGISMPKVW